MNRLLIGHMQAEAAMQAALGCKPVARVALGASIGTPWYSGAKLRSSLAATVVTLANGAKSQVMWPLVWLFPDPNSLKTKSVDLSALPDHPHVVDAWDAMREYGFPCGAATGESCNGGKDPVTGVVTWNYESPAIWRDTFRGIHTHPSKPANVQSYWMYAPGQVVDLDEWDPGDDVVDGYDCTLFGANHVSTTHPSGKMTATFCDRGVAHGKPVISSQVACMIKDGPIGTPEEQAAMWDKWGKPMLAFFAAHKIQGACFLSYPNGSWGIHDWVGKVGLTKPLAAKINASPEWLKYPLIAQPSGPPVVDPGTVTPVGPVTPID